MPPGGAYVVINDGALNRLLHDKHGGVARELYRRGLRVESRAKELCPVDTGRLRASITTQLSERDADLICVVGSSVEYAGYVEDGTVYMAGFHYLADALSAAG